LKAVASDGPFVEEGSVAAILGRKASFPLRHLFLRTPGTVTWPEIKGNCFTLAEPSRAEARRRGERVKKRKPPAHQPEIFHQARPSLDPAPALRTASY